MKFKFTLGLLAFVLLYFYVHLHGLGIIPHFLVIGGGILYLLYFGRIIARECQSILRRVEQEKRNSIVQENAKKLMESRSEILDLMSKSLENLQMLCQNLPQDIVETREKYMDLDETYNFLKDFNTRALDIYKKNENAIIPQFLHSIAINDPDQIPDELYQLLKISAFNLDKIYSMPEDAIRTLETDLFSRYNIDLLKSYHDLTLDRNNFRDRFEDILSEYQNDMMKIEAGVLGEERLQKELELFKDVLTCLYNIRIEPEGETIETDVIVISTHGVYSIEVKNYGEDGNFNLEITSDGQWIKKYSDYDKPMKDVGQQGNRHVGLAQRFMNQKLREQIHEEIPYIYMEPIYVIANDVVRINNDSGMTILRPSQVYNYIRSKPEQIPREYISIIKDIFEANRLPAKKYPQRNYDKELDVLLKYYIPRYLYYMKLGAKHSQYLTILKDKGLISEQYVNAYTDLFIPLQFVNNSDLSKVFGDNFVSGDNAAIVEEFNRFLYE